MALKDFLNQDAQIARDTGHSGYGKDTYGALTDVKCRFSEDSRAIMLPTGEMRSRDAKAHVGADVEVDTGDKFIIGGQEYRVIGQKAARIGSGAVHHKRLDLAKWQS